VSFVRFRAPLQPMNFQLAKGPCTKSYLVSFFVNGCELGATKSTSNPRIKLRIASFFRLYFVGKQYKALSQGLFKKSPVAKAEFTIICFYLF
jgi:hypothetical protein